MPTYMTHRSPSKPGVTVLVRQPPTSTVNAKRYQQVLLHASKQGRAMPLHALVSPMAYVQQRQPRMMMPVAKPLETTITIPLFGNDNNSRYNSHNDNGSANPGTTVNTILPNNNANTGMSNNLSNTFDILNTPNAAKNKRRDFLRANLPDNALGIPASVKNNRIVKSILKPQSKVEKLETLQNNATYNNSVEYQIGEKVLYFRNGVSSVAKVEDILLRDDGVMYVLKINNHSTVTAAKPSDLRKLYKKPKQDDFTGMSSSLRADTAGTNPFVDTADTNPFAGTGGTNPFADDYDYAAYGTPKLGRKITFSDSTAGK